jgi:hypothetical protein
VVPGCGERVRGEGFVIAGAEPASAIRGVPCADIDGDGFDDILVSAGRSGAFIVFGKGDEERVDLGAIAEGGAGGRLIEPGLPGALWFTAEAIGDVNGDGLADIATWSYTYDASVVHVIHGGPALPNPMRPAELAGGTRGFTLVLADDADLAGVRGGGDLNGDGYDELVLSVRSSNSPAGGGSFVVEGAPEPLGQTWSDLEAGVGAFAIDALNVMPVGDVNGDGFDDLAAFHAGTDCDGAGVQVILGGPEPPPSPAQGVGGVRFAPCVRPPVAAGDINGDGLADLVVARDDSSQAYVVFGSLSLATTGFVLEGAAGELGDRGYVIELGGAFLQGAPLPSVVAVGDRNGDGFDDVVIRRWDTSTLAFGKADTAPLVLAEEGLRLDDAPLGAHLGVVTGVAAIRGQGPDDIVIADPDADPFGARDAGRVFVLFDPPELRGG